MYLRGLAAKTISEIRQSQLPLKAAPRLEGIQSLPRSRSSFKSSVFLLDCYWNSCLTPIAFRLARFLNGTRKRTGESFPTAALIINNNTPFNALHPHKFLIRQKMRRNPRFVDSITFLSSRSRYCPHPLRNISSFIFPVTLKTRFMIYYEDGRFCGCGFCKALRAHFIRFGDYCNGVEKILCGSEGRYKAQARRTWRIESGFLLLGALIRFRKFN